MAWQSWQKKKVYIEVNTRNGVKRYSGIIDEVVFLGKNSEGVEIYFLSMIDKFNEKVGFNSNNINLIQEEK